MLKELGMFISRIPKSYHISMPRLHSYLNNVQRGTENLIDRNDRFTTDPIPSNGIDYLNSLITRVDIPYLLKFTNDVDRFVKISKEYQSAVYSDFIRQYPIRDKCFIYSKRGKVLEYVMITDDFDITEVLPFGSDFFEDWKHVHPVTMLANDSTELTLDIVTSRLRYNVNPPKEAIFSVNVIKLLMCYTKYRLMFPERFVNNVNNYPFIYEVCLLPLLYDNVKNWLIKIIYDIVILKSIDPDRLYNPDELKTGEKSVFMLGGRQSALLEIEDLITKCAQGKVKPDEVIGSLLLDPQTNLLGSIKSLMNNHYVGHSGAQFRWLEFVREYHLLAIMVGIYGLQEESNRSIEFKRVFEIVANRKGNTRFWNSASNPFVVQNVKNKFDTICSLI